MEGVVVWTVQTGEGVEGRSELGKAVEQSRVRQKGMQEGPALGESGGPGEGQTSLWCP